MAMPRTINLWPEGSTHNSSHCSERPRLVIYPAATDASTPRLVDGRRPAILICPGGGYVGQAPHEAAPFAEFFARHGFVALVCYYRVAPHRYPAPMADGARAMRLTRQMAPDLGIDPDRIAMMGFSAGGHLVSTIATQPGLHLDQEDELAARFAARPNRTILAYPVISFVYRYNIGSCANLFGGRATLAQREQLSNELHVDMETPPVFLFHTADDDVVPVSNSIRYAQACMDHGIPAELHVYRSGTHGVGLASDDESLCSWTSLLLDWLEGW